jgi:hypothetical protein
VKLPFGRERVISLVEIRGVQETPSAGVEDRSDYLRSGNVKLDDQSLGLADRETS